MLLLGLLLLLLLVFLILVSEESDLNAFLQHFFCVFCASWSVCAHTRRVQVTQHEAHRMLFQCENGRHKGHVRIRSRATNTFLFFLGIKHPLTWVVSAAELVAAVLVYSYEY